jgi:hypothetical protein
LFILDYYYYYYYYYYYIFSILRCSLLGLNIVKEIETYGTRGGQPRDVVRIEECGEVLPGAKE